MFERAAMRDLGGKFRILAELGQGGSSRVWLAAFRGPSGFSKLVVLKSMKDELKSEPELSQMFLNEARLAAQLSHPNIVQTNEVFEHDGLPVIVMEYLDGQSLAAIMARGQSSEGLSRRLLLRILSDALAGLHSAHQLRDYTGLALEVVHRDVSPHNIFVTYDGQTKVLDFGIAKLTGLADATESGVIRGKLHYMAPEQITAGRIDRRADLYAAGVILWEILTGVRMWRGVNEAVVMNRVLGGALPDLTALSPSVPPRLAEIVARATALHPDERFATAAEFQAALDAYLQTSGPEPRGRDVGDAMAKLFSDRQKERRAVVERELSRVAEQSDDEYAGYRPLALSALEVRTDSASQVQKKGGNPQLKNALPWVLALGLAVLLFVVLWGRDAGQAPLSHQQAPAPAQVNQVNQVPSVPREVRVRIAATPIIAKISIDGAPAQQGPLERTLPFDPLREHVVQVSAPGHGSRVDRFYLDSDRELSFALEPVTPEAPAPITSKPKAAPKAFKAPPNAPGSTSLESDCDPPYFYDARGVKKFKAKCL